MENLGVIRYMPLLEDLASHLVSLREYLGVSLRDTDRLGDYGGGELEGRY